MLPLKLNINSDETLCHWAIRPIGFGLAQPTGKTGEAPHGHGGGVGRIPSDLPEVRDHGGALERLCEGANRFEAMRGEELTRGGGSIVALLGQRGTVALGRCWGRGRWRTGQ
jgi:hypothetical protein